ncbi:monocarboxylate transporter 14-like [Ylistrum balloti]|uniref:monocarboxylate transporter 14-like n=1 Tax=Ylistrum balloti TaxID=509963 RepID=UPI002905DFE9|nr:monocarboxylate transporter 14-like [Ylistrum balloti]
MTSESELAENGRAHRDMNSGSDDMSDVKLLDGGYGWVVVGASFFNMFCLDGLIGIYGLLYPEFLLHFGAEPAITALPGSIMVGMSCLVGPVCSKLIRRFGFRRVTVLGACVTSVGLLCSYATHSIAVFFVTHGIITGTGCSLFYLPSVTLVNTYFDRKRGVAQGIITAGSGLGVIVLPPVTKFLIGYYGWRATILLWAGFVLNICVSGLLMRPPPPTQGDTNRHGKPINLETKPHNHSLSSSKQGNEQLQSFSYLHENDWIQTEGVRNQFIYFKNRGHSSTRSLPQCYIDKNENSSAHLGLYRSLQCVHHPKPKQYEQVSMYAQNMLDRKDIFLTGSTNILKSNTSNKYIQSKRVEEMEGTDHICAEIESCMTSENDVSHGLCRGSCKPFTTDPAFLLLVAGSALAQMAQHIPMTFMAEYSELIGLDGQDIATLFILFGVVSIAGRLVCGLLASIQMFGPLFVCNFGTVACAVACFLFWLCTTFETLVVFISVYGFFVGFPFPTQPLITVEYVGLDNLTLAFGLIIMAKGPAAMAGPPMAGSLYQLTQSYIYSVIFAGGPLLLSAAVMSLMPFVGKRRYNTKEGPDTVVTSSSSCCNGRQI